MSDVYNYPYVGYYTAIGLESYKFNRPQFTYYRRKDFGSEVISGSVKRLFISTEPYVTVPTYDEVVTWLREEHGIFVQVMPSFNSPDELIDDKKITGYYHKVCSSARTCIEWELDFFTKEIEYFDTYADALSKAISEAIKLITV